MSQYTDEMRARDARIVMAYLGGRNASDVGREYGLTRERIRQILAVKGVPSRGFEPLKNTEADFWNRVDVRGPDDCWEWLGARFQTGYGHVRFHGRDEYTHRLAHRFARGGVPKGRHVLHHCDNPPCCNPFHLYSGTPADNVRDRDDRGRGRYPRVPGLPKRRDDPRAYARAMYARHRDRHLAYSRARYATKKAARLGSRKSNPQ